MGFFKKTLSSAVGSFAGDFLGDKFGDKIGEKAGDAITDGLQSLGENKSVLDTPAPPSVPTPPDALSVMVAVNGQTYGPYERATLRKMIAEGSLTESTYVFIKGMSDWQPASAVAEVAALLQEKAPLPPTPPVPWANSQPQAPAEKSGHFSARLDSLITAAVADGEISDLERQVLIRNAQEEGVAMDEFVMVLEARLYEQRQALLAKQKAAAAPTPAPAPQPAHTAPRDGNEVKKCPACGAPIKAIATCCPECGYDYNADNGTSPMERLTARLTAIDNEKASGLVGKIHSLMGEGNTSPEKIDKKKMIIKNFPIPSDKKGILDLFIGCASQSGGSIFTSSSNPLRSAYKTKAEQILVKARIIMKDDPKLLEEINELAKKYKIKA